MEKKRNKDERLALRISSELLQAIRDAAEEEDVSLSAYVVEALKEKLKKRKVTTDLAKRVDTLEELLIKQVS
jgi:hypothetical protein